ncbi:phospholipid/cholesterol/gamma-HCH transport system ATP-binding protein [Catalinimonas alkaloidigena]|uniref:ABC transporter ATP-binding protein n=1 Tax=Catalinimonas alkaloidigena TaxID=1075417 RepID=UPI002405F650|nr:ATP-binding cassette domain-containing protein [Catalinimonas alkaloidigena]MDF9795813.1 phospholipid/cholesterol/gamma-HCH transport system ATP-binding protein [Catalinimonas alkaloidigena]
MERQEVHTQMNEQQRNEEPVLVRARGFRKSFGDTDVLRDINFELREGENMVVLGKSGTGKSVLIKSMVGLHMPDEGELNVLDYNLTGINDEDLLKLRRKVGYLFQGGALYDSMTVRDNMRFPLERQVETKPEDEIEELVEEGLKSVGLIDAIDKLPAELSGGMQKRIALARTLILRPKIMLYDEPTTGLDPVTSKEISHLLMDMRDRYNITSIIVTHDIASAEMTADRIHILRNGTLDIQGTFNELANSDDEWVRAFFQ